MNRFFTPEFAACLERLRISTRRRSHGHLPGPHLSARRGHSPEFSDYRDYAPGDDTRFIDWNIFSRLRRPYVKLFLEEQDLHVQVMIDTSASMSAKLAYTLSLSAAIGYIALSNGHRLEVLSARSDAPLASPVMKGAGDIRKLFAFLDGLEAGGALTPQELVLRHVRRRIGGCGIRVLLSDLLADGECAGMGRALVRGGHEGYVLRVLEAQELEPELRQRCELHDREDNGRLRVEPGGIISAYRAEIRADIRARKEELRGSGVRSLILNAGERMEENAIRALRLVGLLR